MNEQLKALYDCFYEPLPAVRQKQEIEDCHQALIAALEKPERRLVLQIIDGKDQIAEDRSIDSFISGFCLAWRLSHELNIYKENRHPEPTDFIGEDACSFIKTEKNN